MSIAYKGNNNQTIQMSVGLSSLVSTERYISVWLILYDLEW